MKKLSLTLGMMALTAWSALAETNSAVVKISNQPLHQGKASTLLYGNFIELLDDLVPAMRAEMLNNRGFEGVLRPVNWAYYDGALNRCDREWQKSFTADDVVEPFNGLHCMKMSADLRHGAASLAQDGMGVTPNGAYVFSGYFRAANTNVQATILLKTKLPDGEWWELGKTALPPIGNKWKKFSGTLRANGTSDNAVFELRVSGFGDVQVDQLSLMPEDNRAGWRFDVIEAIKELRPAVLRWGGSVIDPGGYKWRNAIGDRDKRPSFTNTVWGRIDNNECGVDEFCQLCRVVEARPMVCVSFADGLTNAADLVSYCNDPVSTPFGAKRQANGYARPYKVAYWQVGNEINGDDENYLRQIGDFSRAIKQADFKVQVLSSFPSQKLLTAAGKNLDFVCPHQYTADFAACENELNHLAEMIRNTPDCNQVKIAVTEWNVSAGGWGLQRGKFLTLEMALLNARYLNLLIRHSDEVEIACRSNLANSLGSGLMEVSNKGILRRPSFYTMQLYSGHTLVPKQVLQMSGAPAGVDMVATKMENRNRITVFAVNTKNEPVTIKMDLTAFGEDIHAATVDTLGDTLDARQPDVMNHWNSAKRVSTFSGKVEENDVITLPALSASAIECKPVKE